MSGPNDEKYRPLVVQALDSAVEATALGVGKRKQGKVRDMYTFEDQVVLVTTDRVSAFDRNLAVVPFKGQVLNQCSSWWFEQTKHIIPNHIISVPDPTTIVCKKCKVFPIEFVVRGFITGSTATSMWTNYNKGMREYCGHKLPDGLRKDQRLSQNICTPTTKEEEHDRLISPQEIVQEGWMTQEEWDFCHQKALELFSFGQKIAAERGLLLVDTKYEMGRNESGEIVLVDEIHTPDSSRYWLADTYEERFANNQGPQNIDKDILRRWFKEKCDPYTDKVLPEAPPSLRTLLSLRYIQLYEMITGKDFEFPSLDLPAGERISAGLAKGGLDMATTKKVVLFTDMDKTATCVCGTIAALDRYGLSWNLHQVSSFKAPTKVLDILEVHQKAREKSGGKAKVVVITIAQHSNILAGIAAANYSFPTIASPGAVAEQTGGLIPTNVRSTLQVPPNVPVLTVMHPQNAALAAFQILEL
eukprot:m.167847 g.167847  ORF g.167847 m.167847 type:complete len:472 (+) comp25060_c0_seq11:114-1529(+)